MIFTYAANIDLSRCGTVHRMEIIQDDRYSRYLELSLYNRQKPWSPGEGVMAVVTYVKPDGTGGRYNFLPDDTPAWSVSGNVVTVALAPQVCTAAGRVKLMVSLQKDASQLNTFMMELDVHHNPALEMTSEDYYKVRGTVADSGWEPNMLLGTDNDGNVTAVEIPDVGVLSVNGMAPDENGNVEIEMGGVQTINGVPPDEEGNISISISTLPFPASAEEGQYLRVLSADDNGIITALETVYLDDDDTRKYLYNGVKALALPVWDQQTYPYGVLGYMLTKTCMYFVVGSAPCYKSNTGVVVPGPRIAYRTDDFETWYVSGSYNYDGSLLQTFWSNHDVIYDDNENNGGTPGEIFMAGAEPVPTGHTLNLPNPTGAQAGDLIRVAAVDGTGRPTATAAIPGFSTITLTTENLTDAASGGCALNETDSLALEEAARMGCPLVVNMVLGAPETLMMAISVMMSRTTIVSAELGTFTVFSGRLYNYESLVDAVIMKENDTWALLMVQSN